MFVQFTKENSIARNAGLRPGDQILQCNNFTFAPETPFNEAVSVMKCSGELELIVRKGAGVELFPGESSGYNSSASSVAGDNTPWPPTRLTPTNDHANEVKTNGYYTEENGRATNGVHQEESAGGGQYTNGCTVIRVGGCAEERSNPPTKTTKLAEICMLSQQLETKTTTVLVEVHHSEEDDVSHTNSDSSTDRLTNSSSISSFTSSGCSLNSAISQEIERRSKRANATAAAAASSSGHQQKEKLIKSGLDKEKVEQHEQLMEEFRRAHRKMFTGPCSATNGTEEREEEKLAEQRQQEKLSARSHLAETARHEAEKLARRQSAPPPPPPLPFADVSPGPAASRPPGSSTLAKAKKYPAPPPPPPPPSSASASASSSSATSTPTPDYESSGSTADADRAAAAAAAATNKTRRGDAVEMQSLESFKLTNPSVSRPKPPNTYFTPGATNTNNTTDTVNNNGSLPAGSRPVVTIREYSAGGDRRRSPSRLEFLQCGAGGPCGGGTCSTSTARQPIASRLQSELTQTLSRSNLIAKNEPTVAAPGGGGMVVAVGQREAAASASNRPFFLFQKKPSGGGQAQIEICRALAEQKPKLNSIEANNRNSSVTFNFNTDNNNSNSNNNNNNNLKKPFPTNQVQPAAAAADNSAAQPNGILKNCIPNSNIGQVKISVNGGQKTPANGLY